MGGLAGGGLPRAEGNAARKQVLRNEEEEPAVGVFAGGDHRGKQFRHLAVWPGGFPEVCRNGEQFDW